MPQFRKLCLVRITGSIPADMCIELLEQKLAGYDFNLGKDIICIMTDGTIVMEKVGRLLSVNQQLCFAHGVQLVKVLYQ